MRGFAALAAAPVEARTINDSDFPWTSRSKAGEVAVDETSALCLSAVWACQTLIADAIATLPVDVYRKSEPQATEIAPPSWVVKPNVSTLRVDYETQRLLSLLGWGNAYSLLERANGTMDPMDRLVARFLIDPRAVQVLREPSGRVSYRVAGVDVDARRLQHVRGYALPGGVVGMSVIEHARRSLGMATAADTFGEAFFANGVTPSGVLEVPALPAEASASVIDRLRDQFAARYAGTGNARKPVVLTGGTTWRQITINPVDAQFLDTRMFQIEDIARFYRVPLHEIQRITNNASQGGGQGIEAQSLNLAQRTLLPWTVRLEQADSELLPRGQFLKFNINAYVRADIKTRHEVYQMRRNIGMSNADELRALEDEAPIVDGNGTGYWQPKNMGLAGDPVDPTMGVLPGTPDPNRGA